MKPEEIINMFDQNLSRLPIGRQEHIQIMNVVEAIRKKVAEVEKEKPNKRTKKTEAEDGGKN